MYEHIDEENLEYLLSVMYGLICVDPDTKDRYCEKCPLGKINVVSFIFNFTPKDFMESIYRNK